MRGSKVIIAAQLLTRPNMAHLAVCRSRVPALPSAQAPDVGAPHAELMRRAVEEPATSSAGVAR